MRDGDYITTSAVSTSIDITSLCIVCEETSIFQEFYSSNHFPICKDCINDMKEIIQLKRRLK